MTFLHFSDRFSESETSEHIIKIRKAMKFRRTAKEQSIEELTEYKREYKKSKEGSNKRVLCLLLY